MEAWGIGPFDNYEACNFLDTIEMSLTLTPVEETLFEVAAEEPPLTATAAWRAIAAAEILAALRGRPCSTMPTSALEWVAEQSGHDISALIPLACNALDCVRQGGELHDLWEESDKLDEWRVLLDDLAERLGTDPTEYAGG